ncbi:MAG: type II toxin-antitoxin system Phd/YefM family antitoxin [Tepidiformaceae bacterium]
MSAAVTVGVREFKAHLSEYLRRVKAGEVVVITDRGRPVGRLIPEATGASEVEAKAWEMVAAGKADWNGQRLRDFKPVEGAPGVLVSDVVVQEREEAARRLLRNVFGENEPLPGQ